MTHIAIIALGSRGDVQPYIALGGALQQAGHTVRLITHENYAALVAAHGLDFHLMRGNVQAVAEQPEIRARLAKGDLIGVMRLGAVEAERAARLWAEDGLAATHDRDLLIAGFGGMFTALALAEKRDRPVLQAHLAPFTPTRAFPAVILPAAIRSLGGPLNYASHHITRQVIWQTSRSSDAVARRDVLQLPPAPFFGPFHSPHLLTNPVLYGISPSVIPPPADWHGHTHLTGYWFLDTDTDWQPPADLLNFLNDGPPPVCIGFGSMGSQNPEQTTALILAAFAQSGQRAVLLSGWGGLNTADLPKTVYTAAALPHSWLFPRCAAVVHHGGAGTTAAGLRAGVPSVITPFFADQPFWANRVYQLGAGPRPIPHGKLTAHTLATALQAATGDDAIRQRAADLGHAIRAEHGLATAVNLITSART